MTDTITDPIYYVDEDVRNRRILEIQAARDAAGTLLAKLLDARAGVDHFGGADERRLHLFGAARARHDLLVADVERVIAGLDEELYRYASEGR